MRAFGALRVILLSDAGQVMGFRIYLSWDGFFAWRAVQ